MCLKRIDNYGVRKKGMLKEKGFHVGYKLFLRVDGKIQPYYFRKFDIDFEIGKWMNEKDFRPYASPNDDLIQTDSGRYYGTGFHMYISSNIPITYSDQILRKVFFRNIITAGWETCWGRSRKVVVAKEMFIVPLRGWIMKHKTNLRA